MPRTPTDYSKTIIYKIQSINNPELLYVGSTTNFTKRKFGHKSNCHNTNTKKYNIKLYEMIRENGGWDMFNMVIVKEFPCENKRQAEAEEDRIIRETKSNMNMKRAFVTPDEHIELRKQYRLEHKDQMKQYNLEHKEQRKQYYLEHKEQRKERDKQYYLEHKDQMKEQMKQYYLEHKEQRKERNKQYYLENRDKKIEQMKQYKLEHKEQMKQYYLENRDKKIEQMKQYKLEHKEQIAEQRKQYRLENKEQIAEQMKQYRLEHKEQIAERDKQKITCDCGCVIRKDSLPKHKRTKKHQDLLNKHLV